MPTSNKPAVRPGKTWSSEFSPQLDDRERPLNWGGDKNAAMFQTMESMHFTFAQDASVKRWKELWSVQGQTMRLFVMVQGYEIVVTSETGFRAEYWKRPNHPQLKVRRCTETDNYELLAQAWQLANAKARELGWIV
jgi:hypothetical protein